MTKAKKEAVELVDKFAELIGAHDRQITYNPQPMIGLRDAKKCALILVNSKIIDYAKMSDLESLIAYNTKDGLNVKSVIELIEEQRAIIKELKKL